MAARVDIVALGEPMLEFNAAEVGTLDGISSYETGWGGDTSNFAVAAARLGRSVAVVGRIGGDPFGRSFLNMWSQEGVDASHMIIEQGGFTGIYFVSRCADGTHDFTYYRRDSAASHCRPEDLDEEFIARARVLHSSAITQAISDSSCDAVFRAVEIAKDNGVLFSYDPNLRLKLWSLPRAKAVINLSLELADIAFPSWDEARLITGLQQPEAIAREMLRRGVRIVALKLGNQGCLVATSQMMFSVPPMSVEVVDTSGAGDAFDAGFVVGMLEGWDLRRTACFANAVGALTCMGKGCVRPIPSREQVQRHLLQTGTF